MSDARQDDPQDLAESTDEDKIDPTDFPPDQPMGVEDDDLPESYAERDERYEPLDEERIETVDDEWAEDAPMVDVGQLVDPAGALLDDEERMVADALGGTDLSAEEAAVAAEPEIGERGHRGQEPWR